MSGRNLWVGSRRRVVVSGEWLHCVIITRHCMRLGMWVSGWVRD